MTSLRSRREFGEGDDLADRSAGGACDSCGIVELDVDAEHVAIGSGSNRIGHSWARPTSEQLRAQLVFVAVDLDRDRDLVTCLWPPLDTVGAKAEGSRLSDQYLGDPRAD